MKWGKEQSFYFKLRYNILTYKQKQVKRLYKRIKVEKMIYMIYNMKKENKNKVKLI